MSQSFIAADSTPLLTADLPGTGGALGGPDDFIVEEIPAYLPCGAGQHAFAWVEKRGLTTPAAVQSICAALSLDARQAGYAGMKDKHAVTRQWLSFEGADPAELMRLELPGLRVINAACHGNKLRTGHLRGNRFEVVLRGVCADAQELARTALARLSADGLPNYYGTQRFGARGDNATTGLRVLRGLQPPSRDKRQRRMIASALQSQLFNEVLAARLAEGSLLQLLDGDVLQRADGHGVFVSEDCSTDQQRLDRREVVITGPMCGPRMIRPRTDSRARSWEDAILSRFDLAPDDFAAWGRIARGGRRPLSVSLEQAEARQLTDESLQVCFGLPAGSYASVALREVAKKAVVGPRTAAGGA